MKRVVQTIIILAVMCIVTSYSCYASSSYDVRVRIRSPRKYNQYAELKGYEKITVYDKSDGNNEVIFESGDQLSCMIDAYYDDKFKFLENKNSTDAKIGPYHLQIEESIYDTMEEVQKAINELSSNNDEGFYPYYNGTGYEIWEGAYKDSKEADAQKSTMLANDVNTEVVNGDKKNIAVYNSDNEIVFMYKNNFNIYFTSYNKDISSDMIKIDGKSYRGMMGFYITAEPKLISINYVDLESYIYGVVPNEIGASWPLESIKAQAVAARTYAASFISPAPIVGYDLEDNQNSQVYKGYESENAATNKAVDETVGKMIYYNNKLIEAYFHSSSGGYTEDSENIWYNKVDYLRGVEDEYSNISPQSQWTKTASKEYIIQKLKEDKKDVKDLYSIEITKVSNNNRVLECKFYTDKGEIVYLKENIRRVLGYDFLLSSWFTIGNGSSAVYFTNEKYALDETANGKYNTVKDPSDSIEDNKHEKEEIKNDADPSILDAITDLNTNISKDSITDDSAVDTKNHKILNSGNLTDKYVISDTQTASLDTKDTAFISSQGVTTSKQNNNTSDYVFNGRGWGHGIGMSQYGAKQMATEGFNYEQILKHYYTGVEIK